MLQGFLKGMTTLTESASSRISQGVEKRIVELMAADYSWEQVIYDIIAAEGLDPWNLDLALLSSSFLSYIGKVKELDFRIPAKYVIISSVILKMKSDNLRLLEIPSEGGEELPEDFIDGQPVQNLPPNFNLNFFDLQQKRRPTRQVTVADLINSLKRVLNTQEMRELKLSAARDKIKISTEGITERINRVYAKINSLMAKIKNEEVKFSNVVGEWERQSIVSNFLPLVYLDNEKKINCRQEEFFQEIYIKKFPENGNGNTNSHSDVQKPMEEPKILAKPNKKGVKKHARANLKKRK